jgi:hypothetical protein
MGRKSGLLEWCSASPSLALLAPGRPSKSRVASWKQKTPRPPLRPRPPKQIEAGLTLCIADVLLLRRWRAAASVDPALWPPVLLRLSLRPALSRPDIPSIAYFDPSTPKTLKRCNAPTHPTTQISSSRARCRDGVGSSVRSGACKWTSAGADGTLLTPFAGVGRLRITSQQDQVRRSFIAGARWMNSRSGTRQRIVICAERQKGGRRRRGRVLEGMGERLGRVRIRRTKGTGRAGEGERKRVNGGERLTSFCSSSCHSSLLEIQLRADVTNHFVGFSSPES